MSERTVSTTITPEGLLIEGRGGRFLAKPEDIPFLIASLRLAQHQAENVEPPAKAPSHLKRIK